MKINTKILISLTLVLYLYLFSIAIPNREITICFDSKPNSATFDSWSFATAVESSLTFTSGGTAPWVIDTTTSKAGSSSGKSGVISHSQISYLEAVVAAKGKISFWWKVSSQYSSDDLTFIVEGEFIKKISGLGGDWQYFEFNIGSDLNTVLRWVYSKDGSTSSGSDCGWIDNVTWTPMNLFNSNDFALAVDAPSLVFTSGGYVPWRIDTTTTAKNGSSSGLSGAIPLNRNTWVSTTVTGTGTLKFWYKILGNSFDTLEFFIDSNKHSEISANTNWQEIIVSINSSSSTLLNWSFTRGSIYLGVEYYAWIDSIQWIPDATTTTTTTTSSATTSTTTSPATTNNSTTSSTTTTSTPSKSEVPSNGSISGYSSVIFGMIGLVMCVFLIKKQKNHLNIA
jgi:hypothetical protein